jgi:SAM-dependent methyltransferase
MTSQDEYFDYLITRSFIGGLYRRYWLYPKISSHLHGTALDIGCGIGDMLAFRKNTFGVDVNSRNVDYCQSLGLNAKLMQPDILPFESNTFDSALLDNVLEHIVNPQPLLREVQRVLRPRSFFVVGVPGVRGWKSDSDHKVEYDETSMKQCLAGSGFVHVSTFHAPLGRSSWLSRILRQYCIYCVFMNGGS